MTSAIRLGSRGDSYYEYLLCVHHFCISHEISADSFSQEAVHSDCAFHILIIMLSFQLISMNVRIAQRVFTVRQVGRDVTTSPSRLTMSADV